MHGISSGGWRHLAAHMAVVAAAAIANPLVAQHTSGDLADRVAGDDRVTVVAGAQYRRGRLHQLIFGEQYRDLWAMPIRVPRLDPDTFAGGLTAKKRGGGQQTRSLRFEGENGREYVFRLVEKDPTPGLPAQYRGTLVNQVVRDGISAANPSGAPVVSAILDATDIPHARPRLAVMPATRRLRQFQDFANKLGYIEERPTDGFMGATRVVDSQDLLDILEKDPGNQVDTRELLTARLVDQLVGDWDRHRDQWDWGAYPDRGRTVWRPIPRDRDQAFSRYDSPLVRFYPKLVKFGKRYPSVVWLTWNGNDLDRRLLTDLTADDFDSVAVALQALVTDSVLLAAVERMPKPYQDLWGSRLAAELRGRRDALPAQARRYYRLLAEDVDVHGSDADEIVIARRHEDGALTLRIRRRTGSSPTYERRFEPSETHEVRLFLHGGADRVDVVGQTSGGPTLRIIRDVADDTVNVATGTGRVALYDPLPKPPRPENEDSAAPDPPPRDWGGSSRLAPTGAYDSDLGILVGMRASRVDYAFRREPYGSLVRLGAQYAPGLGRFRTGVHADVRRIDPRTRLELEVTASELDVIRFTGLGNETPFPGNTRFFGVDQWRFAIAPVIRHAPRPTLRLWGGPVLRYTTSDLHQDRLVATQRPRGSAGFGRVGVRIGAALGPVDSGAVAKRLVALAVSGELFPPVWTVASTYGRIKVAANAWLPLADPESSPALAARLGAERVWGPFPYDEAAFLGGNETLRGFQYQRFAGDASLYGGLELHVPVGLVLRHLVPTWIGVFALGDAGRVWARGSDSRVIHAAAGGGVTLSFFEPRHTLSVAVASSAEGTRWHLRTGMGF